MSVDTCRFVLAAIVTACNLPSLATAADTCSPATARVVSVQGSVEVRRPSSAVWQEVRLNDPICGGDMLRVGEPGRAGLLLNNETTLRLDQNTTLTLAVPDKERPSLLDLLSGVIHVISRTPRPFRVKNQYLNAAVEGTEFLVAVTNDSARVAVYEGRVTADNEFGSVAVAAGEQAIAAKGSAPRKEVLVRPRDAVQWALYFPAIFDYSVAAAAARAPEDSALRESIELYRKGRLADAIGRLKSVPEGLPNARLLFYRAGLLLLVGRLDEARADIGQALTLDPDAAKHATALDPDLAKTQTVLGFAYLVRIDTRAAKAAFEKAIELDQADPLPRLGLGLVIVREGDLKDGREQIEIATSLDPGR